MSDIGAFKPLPDKGVLHAVGTKTNPLGKDYFGEIAINLKDSTNFRIEDGMTIIKLSGWKNVSKASGKTYLALVVDRWIPPTQQAQVKPQDDIDDEDLPF